MESVDGKDWDELELELIDAGATDIEKDDNGLVIFTEVVDFGKMIKKIEELEIKPSDSGLEYVSKTKKDLSGDEEEKLLNLLDVLDDLDDVDKVFHEAG